MPRLLVCGSINWDKTLFVNRLPAPGEEIRVEKMDSVPGGKGGNTSVAAARILGKGEVAIIGMLGHDEIAEMQITILKQEGIDVSCISRHGEMASGQAYVIVDSKGENMILTHHAANKGLTPQSMVSEKMTFAIEKSNMVIIIDPPLDAAFELATQAVTRGKTVVLSPATLVSNGFSGLERLLRSADYILLNEHEARILASTNDGMAACESLSSRLGGKPVITTLGSQGCILCQAGRIALVPTIDPAMLGLKTASTVGAGDTFVGSFAAFRLLGRDILRATFLANIAAALKITREQTRGSPDLEELTRHAESKALREIYERVKFT